MIVEGENLKTIKICSKIYDLRFDKSNGEGSFVTMTKSGKGKITIGTQYGLADQAAKVVHESIEAILTEDDKRFYNYTNSHERANFVFIFDHDYLCQLEHKLIDALLTSGFFKLTDGKK